jgi:GR25 family glycosyltransferase involved in LPS biosynthesis
MAHPAHRGLFINMARSLERLGHMRVELRRFGLSDVYRRLHAIDMPANPVHGCFFSHLKAIETARGLGGVVHIVEDDVILSEEAKEFLSSKNIVELLAEYDILLLDNWVDPYRIETYRQALRNPGILNLKGHRIGAAASYVISPAKIGKIYKLLQKAGPMPADNAMDRLTQAGTIKVGLTVPFLTGVSIGIGSQSYIQRRLKQNETAHLLALRTAFSVIKDRQPYYQFNDDPGMPAPDGEQRSNSAAG